MILLRGILGKSLIFNFKFLILSFLMYFFFFSKYIFVLKVIEEKNKYFLFVLRLEVITGEGFLFLLKVRRFRTHCFIFVNIIFTSILIFCLIFHLILDRGLLIFIKEYQWKLRVIFFEIVLNNLCWFSFGKISE